MTLLVEEVITELNNSITVIGQSGIGAFMGTWSARAGVPEVGKTYCCELTLPELNGKDMLIRRYQDTPTYTDIALDGKVVFKGICYAIEDGSAVVGFSDDWIEVMEFSGIELHMYDTIRFFLDKEDIRIIPYEEEELIIDDGE